MTNFLRSSIALLAILLLVLLGQTSPSSACWVVTLQECFERQAQIWPWAGTVAPQRWRNCSVVNGQTFCWPNIPNNVMRWGITSGEYFDHRICTLDDHAAWIIGQPVGQDPEFDGYPPNYDTYMTYGPIDLSNVVAAQVSFYLYNRSEPGHDSVYWGAATASTLTSALMRIGDRHAERMAPGSDFMLEIMDLANLTDYQTHAPVSMIGEPIVYVFWRFQSDATANPPPANGGDIGAFVDEVVIAYDNGGIDLSSGAIHLMQPDSDDVPVNLAVGDTLWSSYIWTTCDGGVSDYPDFHAMAYVAGDQGDTTIILDTLISGAQPSARITLYSNLWVIQHPGNFTVRYKLDTLNQVTETNENNNSAYSTYYINPPNDPPVFTWLAPGEQTLFADSIARIRWDVRDPDETALVSIYYDQDQFGCEGIFVPGGSNHEEHDGPDSVLWNIYSQPQDRVIWLFARVSDAIHDTCIYSPHPLVIDHSSATHEPRSDVPTEFALSQNFPNPFNPTTRISYSISEQSPVSLRVFDIQGRIVATLVNETLSPGYYYANFDGANLASGIYLYSLTTPSFTQTHKMVLMK